MVKESINSIKSVFFEQEKDMEKLVKFNLEKE
jgi:hypothetical protein